PGTTTERSEEPGRSARLRRRRGARQRTSASLRAAVELRLGKIRRRLAQNLVRLAQLAILALELFQSLQVRRGRPGTNAAITLGLSNPTPQGFGRTTDLAGNRADRSPLRVVVPLVLQHHPNRSFLYFGGKLRLSHGSILSREGASGKAGAVQSSRSCGMELGGSLTREDVGRWGTRTSR